MQLILCKDTLKIEEFAPKVKFNCIFHCKKHIFLYICIEESLLTKDYEKLKVYKMQVLIVKFRRFYLVVKLKIPIFALSK
jgi:hypothetical protein